MIERKLELNIARVLADLLREDPELYELFKSSMQDPRQNHMIREEPEWDD